MHEKISGSIILAVTKEITSIHVAAIDAVMSVIRLMLVPEPL